MATDMSMRIDHAPATLGTGGRAVSGATLFLFIGWTFIHVHHYFIDNMIRRRDNPKARRYLFTASGRPAPHRRAGRPDPNRRLAPPAHSVALPHKEQCNHEEAHAYAQVAAVSPFPPGR